MKRRTKELLHTYTLLLPWLLTLAIFWLFPLIYAAWLSLTKYNTLANTSVFIGFDNYIKIFSDTAFLQALSNTAFFAIGTVPVTTALSILLAVLLNSKFARLTNFFKASYFIPSVTSMVVIALIFTNLYSKDGYLNGLLNILGMPFPERGWLLEPATSLLSIMAMDVWMATGYYMILFLAGMQTIPNDLYDAADLAGASKTQQFFRITLPLLKPTLLFVIIINTIKSFQVFIEIYVMTKGGPMGSTTTLVYLVFENAFNRTDMLGYASAIAYILFIILIVFSFVQKKLLKAD